MVSNLILGILGFWFSSLAEPAKLSVEFTNVRKGKGKLLVAIYKPNDKFGDEKPGIAKIIEVNSTASHFVTFDLEPGKYALAVYHDLNGNEILDKNFVGIPKEPYGFSNNFRPRFSAPSFNDCAFELPANGQKLLVKLTN